MWKASAAERPPGSALRLKRDKALMLFAGTKVVQHTGAERAAGQLRPPDGGCAALVLRAGFDSKQARAVGSMWHTIMRDRTCGILPGGLRILPGGLRILPG